MKNHMLISANSSVAHDGVSKSEEKKGSRNKSVCAYIRTGINFMSLLSNALNQYE